METSQRIEFIDLAKGICIILVVFGHCHLSTGIPGMTIVRMPLYYILSGLFFKEFINWGVINKINRLIIPFLFFFATGIILDNINHYITGAEVFSLRDCIKGRQLFNAPTWFLISLFWVNLFAASIFCLFKNEYLRIALALLLGFVGVFVGSKGFILPIYIDSSLSAMPFFLFGYYIGKTSLLRENRYDRYSILIIVGLYLLSYAISQLDSFTYGPITNHMGGNIILLYLYGALSTVVLLLLCKKIKHIPFISYVGRYSIIILCTHWIVIKVLVRLPIDFTHHRWIYATLTLLCSVLFIPICKKYIPWFVAQKDLIKIKNQL